MGEALGDLNGIKALTEGFGPLLFGGLMQLYSSTNVPGAPYLLAAIVSAFALLHSFELPSAPEVVYHKAVAAVTASTSDDVEEEICEGVALLDYGSTQ